MEMNNKRLPHRLDCRLGVLTPLEPTFRNLFKRGVHYDFGGGQNRWGSDVTYRPAVVLNEEVKPRARGGGEKGLLLTGLEGQVYYALGGIATGWRYVSGPQDPTDIIIPEDRLWPYPGFTQAALSSSGFREFMSQLRHPEEVHTIASDISRWKENIPDLF